jgi:hypothetical protein
VEYLDGDPIQASYNFLFSFFLVVDQARAIKNWLASRAAKGQKDRPSGTSEMKHRRYTAQGNVFPRTIPEFSTLHDIKESG